MQRQGIRLRPSLDRNLSCCSRRLGFQKAEIDAGILGGVEAGRVPARAASAAGPKNLNSHPVLGGGDYSVDPRKGSPLNILAAISPTMLQAERSPKSSG